MPLELVAIVVVDGDTHETGSRLTQRWHLDRRVLIIDEDPLGDEGILAAQNGGDTFHQYLPEPVDGCCGEFGLQLKELLGSIALDGGKVSLDRGQEFLVPIVGRDTGYGAGETEGTAWDEMVVFVDSGIGIFHDLVSHLKSWDRCAIGYPGARRPGG